MRGRRSSTPAARVDAHLQHIEVSAEIPTVVSCPHCGLVLQTLDLPCPVCSQSSPVDENDWTLHEYSKTFETRHLFRPKTDAFAAELNAWLAEQPGLVRVAPIIHFDSHGVVRGATLTCTASSRPALESFRLFRLPLRRFIGRPRKDIGKDLNRWADEHPDLTRVGHQVMKSYGVPVECWVLARGPLLPDSVGNVLPRETTNSRTHAWSRQKLHCNDGCVCCTGRGTADPGSDDWHSRVDRTADSGRRNVWNPCILQDDIEFPGTERVGSTLRSIAGGRG